MADGQLGALQRGACLEEGGHADGRCQRHPLLARGPGAALRPDLRRETCLAAPGVHGVGTLYDECRASCGVVEQFEHPEYATEFIHVPGSDAIAALTAEGISMEPSIHSGDYCLIGSSIDLQDADDKHIYLIVTKDGHCMFKRIFNEGRRAENILVLSENPDYSPHAQAVAKADILHVYPLRYVVHRMW